MNQEHDHSSKVKVYQLSSGAHVKFDSKNQMDHVCNKRRPHRSTLKHTEPPRILANKLAIIQCVEWSSEQV